MSIFENNFITNFFGRRGNPSVSEGDKIIKDLSKVEEQVHQPKIQNTKILEDKRNNELLGGEIDSVSQVVSEGSVPSYSPSDLSKLIASDDFNLGQILTGLKADISLNEVYRENEEMARDSVIGSAMEITADDICQVDERTGKIVNIESDDEGLQKFLSDFLENNVNIEERIWTWTYEVVKHGDFKLRRREYYAGSANSNVKSVYYEDVLNPYSVSRIEYMGNVLGFEDDDFYLDSIGTGIGYDGTFRGQAGQQVNSSSLAGNNSATFEKADSFVHFLSAKLSRRDKIVLNVKGGLDEKGKKREKLEPVVCYKVTGTSIMDNARYIFRIINMLDNMLILSRVARSTQYNLVKVEVGNASPGKTQQILSDIRRRLEGSTRLKKNVGMKTDPSPIPINSNVYIPTRDGKGDVTVDSVGDAVDVRSIVDIDYFKDKEFASIKFPKAYLGFEECLKYETKVRLLDGHVYEIGYMAEHPEVWQGKYVMTCSADGSFEPSLISHVKKTRLNATFVKVTLDNGEVVMVTPDHLMMMRDGTFKEAGSLVSGDSLMPFNHWYEDGRLVVRQNKKPFENKKEYQYRVVEEFMYKNSLGTEIPKKHQVHHKDKNRSNDDPSNLEVLSLNEHYLKHVEDFSEKGHEANKGREVTEETRNKLSNSLKGRKFDEEHKNKISKSLKGMKSNNPFRSGEDNIMKDSNVVSKQKESLAKYYGNGGLVWNAREENKEKTEQWTNELQFRKYGHNLHSEVRTFTCPNCGKVFTKEIQPHEYMGGEDIVKFCSKSCASKYFNPTQSKDITVECVVCGNEIVKSMTEEKALDYIKQPHFCSKGCLNKGRKLIYSLRACESINELSDENYNRFVVDAGMVGKTLDYNSLVGSYARYISGYQNHKVVSVEVLTDNAGNLIVEDAYDLGVVSENHTFPLEVGIFVHNSIGGVLGNNSLAKMDIRYARSVQRVQNIMVNGIKSLCNNYLIYRGRLSDINKFKVRMRPITTSDTMGRVEEYVTCMSVFDSSQTFLQEYGQYIDKAKFLKATLGLIGISPSEIASEEFMTILQELEKGTYKEENHKVEEPSEEGFE